MRTTITLTSEADALVRRVMRERGLSLKDAVNAAIVEGLTHDRDDEPYVTPTFDMGPPRVPLERALAVDAALGDEALLAKTELGK